MTKYERINLMLMSSVVLVLANILGLLYAMFIQKQAFPEIVHQEVGAAIKQVRQTVDTVGIMMEKEDE